jgi:hypothetical protein
MNIGKLLPFTVSMYRGRTLAFTLWGNNSKINERINENSNENEDDNNDDNNDNVNDNNVGDDGNNNDNFNNNNGVLPPLNMKNKHWKNILKIGDEIYIANIRFKIVDQVHLAMYMYKCIYI